MTTITAPTVVASPVRSTDASSEQTAGFVARMRDRHRRASADRRTRRAVARAMAAAPTAASRQELHVLLAP